MAQDTFCFKISDCVKRIQFLRLQTYTGSSSGGKLRIFIRVRFAIDTRSSSQDIWLFKKRKKNIICSKC